MHNIDTHEPAQDVKEVSSQADQLVPDSTTRAQVADIDTLEAAAAGVD